MALVATSKFRKAVWGIIDRMFKDVQQSGAMKQLAVAINPTENKGEIAVNNGTGMVALTVGADGEVLTVDSTADAGVSWQAGGSGASERLDVVVDFGATFTHMAETVGTGQTWVNTAKSRIVCTPKAAAGEEAETPLFEFSPAIHTLVNGVGFTLSVYTPQEARGTYTFAVIGT